MLAKDFRYLARQLFQALRSLCQLADELIKMSLDQFNSTGYVSAVVTSEELLQSQLETIIEQFIASTTNNFLLTLRTIGNTTQANGLASVLFTSQIFLWNAQRGELGVSWLELGNNCTCKYTSTCNTRSFVFENDWKSIAFEVPGIYRGCFILEALRQSNLRCFYDSHCLEDLDDSMEINASITYTALNASSLINFETDTLLRVIIDALMVNEWKWNISHSKYFEVCQPKECTYTMVSRNSWIEIVTRMIGLVGGLTTILKFVVPRIVQLIRWLCRRRTAQTTGKLRSLIGDAGSCMFIGSLLFSPSEIMLDHTCRREIIKTHCFHV